MQAIPACPRGLQDALMAQQHTAQEGLFLVTTNAKGRVPWLTIPGVPEVLIDNLTMTRNLYGARLYAFCVLPNHMHIIVNPGPQGISKFMHSFKRQAIDDIHKICHTSGGARTSATDKWDFAWQRSFHLRGLTDDRAIAAALAYVQHNALHHHVVDDTAHWPWSSVHYPHLVDAMTW